MVLIFELIKISFTEIHPLGLYHAGAVNTTVSETFQAPKVNRIDREVDRLI